MPYSATFEGSTPLPRKTIYSRLADFGGLKKYFAEAIEECDLEGAGIGSVRTIRMKGKQGVIVERLEVLVDGSLISYSIINDAPLPLERYHSVIALSDEGVGLQDPLEQQLDRERGSRTRGARPHRWLLQGYLCGRATRCVSLP